MAAVAVVSMVPLREAGAHRKTLSAWSSRSISEGVLHFAQMQAAGSSGLELSLVPESLPNPGWPCGADELTIQSSVQGLKPATQAP